MNLIPEECRNLPRLSGLLLIDTQAQVRCWANIRGCCKDRNGGEGKYE